MKKIREQEEEEKRKLMDIEEEKLAAERRREQIEKAKQLMKEAGYENGFQVVFSRNSPGGILGRKPLSTLLLQASGRKSLRQSGALRMHSRHRPRRLFQPSLLPAENRPDGRHVGARMRPA